ncbi:hypothetical protein N657DRAFT_648894 [Parathielavia appendiculata]|uniref:Uncharacterized protein n=1 Tax=Parathielavia appendiculata TaxID=2587402 RepID=A0AAN6TVH8_9PEZI|nr:hypothetical protein N657DRAFT_648894 [Parathielavia appendiculata]
MLPPNLQRGSVTSPDVRNPISRMFEPFGSKSDLGSIMLADHRMNFIKGMLIGLNDPMKVKTFEDYIKRGLLYGEKDLTMYVLDSIKTTISAFRYLSHPEVRRVFVDTATNIPAQAAVIGKHTIAAPNLDYRWDEFMAALTRAVPYYGRDWVLERILHVFQEYGLKGGNEDKFRLLGQYLLELPNINMPYLWWDPDKVKANPIV